ncbi:GNAT family N-acetyltransferase [Thioalkalivibrio sp. XN279]|uniref:GNAT family N-acetyltransferase n=1 Tax=Thioalkalivibrio sp. XN279 TaxID=2714953 RepID=UPI0014082DF3|nr:GNAT family N-acetyltransferase [Thioalkalivibrio sp. XN279]NHA15371.1 GNAT family N-acetyltransferase [Thioalkalivibrio sp. XN279]
MGYTRQCHGEPLGFYPMKYTVILTRELDNALASRWSAIQATGTIFASPYFRPEFAQALAAVRDDLRICLLEDYGRVVGFFPFHYGRGGVGRPAGLKLSDHHGVVVERDAEWTVLDLLRGSGLVRWEFDHLVAGQGEWKPYIRQVDPSPIIETIDGYEAYEADRTKSQRKHLQDTLRRMRKLERERGPIRYVSNTREPTVFDAMVRWKREQCQATGVVDFFALPWTVELIKRIHEQDSQEFGGTLSALYVGDRLAAVHFAMRSRTVWHSWFPAYDDEFRQYAPGLILLVHMIQHACEDGLAHIDLGKGMAPYKENFMSGSIPVAEGIATRPSIINSIHELRTRSEAWARQSALRPLLQAPGRWLKEQERRRRYG